MATTKMKHSVDEEALLQGNNDDFVEALVVMVPVATGEKKEIRPPSPGVISTIHLEVKLGLVCLLITQNALLNLSARRARVDALHDVETTGCPFQNKTTVVTIEMGKTIGAFFLLWLEVGGFGAAMRSLYRTTTEYPWDSAKILVPALLYTITNNLLLEAAELLEGPLLALFGQIKIVATGILTVSILGRRLGLRSWLALTLLMISVAAIQVSKRLGDPGGGDAGHQNVELGLLVVTISCFLSAFAGVYFELVLKVSPISLWIRNIHLALLSVGISSTATFAHSSSRDAISRCGFFGGYDHVSVVLFLLVQIVGGLLIGGVIKYTDNIIKNFATAASLVLVTLLSVIFFGFAITKIGILGVTGVVYAILLYADVLKDLPGYRELPRPCGGAKTLSLTLVCGGGPDGDDSVSFNASSVEAPPPPTPDDLHDSVRLPCRTPN